MRALLLASICFALVACHRPEAATTETTRAVVPPQHAQPQPQPSASIYPLDVALRDFDDAKIGVDVFRGHPVVISMFYGTCPAACPLLVTHVKRIEAALSPEARADVRVLFVSFDAERDTPAALRGLASAHRVDVTRWRFASAEDDAARQLANVLGIQYTKGDEGFFSHNSVITVLDRDGRVVARTDDPSADLEPLITVLARR